MSEILEGIQALNLQFQRGSLEFGSVYVAEKVKKFSKTVLVFLSSGSNYALQMFAGVRAYAQRKGWSVVSAEYQAVDGQFVGMARAPAEDVAGVIDFWKPDGCVVDFYPGSDSWLDKPFEGIPTVYFERYNPKETGPVCVYCDSASVARLAARELLRFDFADYAFVPYEVESIYWSRIRSKVFSQCVVGQGKRLHVFECNGSKNVHPGAALREWLLTLPRPCGIFAANDMVAESVLAACEQSGISVPKEMVVIGVDDLEHVCESTMPTLTSIGRDFDLVGRSVAGLLDEMMNDPDRLFSSRPFPSSVVIRRASTNYLPKANQFVYKAMEYIRQHACEGIGPRDVVASLGAARTPSDLAFRKATGHTLLDEIHTVRLEQAKTLLAKGVAVAVVSDRCGYTSLVDFRRVFRQRVGKTITSWLNAQKIRV